MYVRTLGKSKWHCVDCTVGKYNSKCRPDAFVCVASSGLCVCVCVAVAEAEAEKKKNKVAP